MFGASVQLGLGPVFVVSENKVRNFPNLSSGLFDRLFPLAIEQNPTLKFDNVPNGSENGLYTWGTSRFVNGLYPQLYMEYSHIYAILLYYIISYYITLHYIILYYIVLYYIIYCNMI